MSNECFASVATWISSENASNLQRLTIRKMRFSVS